MGVPVVSHLHALNSNHAAGDKVKSLDWQLGGWEVVGRRMTVQPHGWMIFQLLTGFAALLPLMSHYSAIVALRSL